MVNSLKQYDLARVVRLLNENRTYDGTDSVGRAPRIGDVATICHEYEPSNPLASVAVEMVDESGRTIWLAEFSRDELELVSGS